LNEESLIPLLMQTDNVLWATKTLRGQAGLDYKTWIGLKGGTNRREQLFSGGEMPLASLAHSPIHQKEMSLARCRTGLAEETYQSDSAPYAFSYSR